MNKAIPVKHNGIIFYGFKKCPTWLKERYTLVARGICEDCHKKKPLEPHRIKRGCDGGLYMYVPKTHVLNNVKMLCHTCHEKYNYSRRLNYSL